MFENAKIIDMNCYARRSHYEYFMGLAYPYLGCTVNVDITGFLQSLKSEKRSFFLSFLYHAVNAANSIPEMRQRLYESGIIEFDSCCSSHTVARADGTYGYCKLCCDMPIEEFLPYAQIKQNEAKSNSGLDEHDDALSLYFISSTPWISYTYVTQPVPYPADSNPRITWGKYFEQNGRTLIPVSLLCNHALMDGMHLGKFYEELERRLKNG